MNKEELSTQLLEWYYEVKRDLPWRKQKNAYHVWVSEIMLQQTRVETVKPYFERFMQRFPTIHDLSEAQEEEVLKYWEGLGYYSRARNLHAAVKEVQSTYGGVIPDDEKEIRKLKGIGPYTMGAILSIAYDKPVPAVDGNVLRVISRMFHIEKDIAKTSTRIEVEDIVRELIPHHDPSGFNQALMELGALVCIPRTPKCSICPVQALCVAKANGKEKVLPIKNKKESKKDVHLVTIVYVRGEHVLIRQRQQSLLKNLWEFPSWERDREEKLTAEKLMLGAKENHTIEPLQFRYAGSIKHTFSHLRWHMEVYIAEVDQSLGFHNEQHSNNNQFDRWVSIQEIHDYPFPVPHQKIIALLMEHLQKHKI